MNIVELTDKEAEVFIEMRRAKIFELANGNAIFSFNSDGILVNIKLEQNVFHRTRLHKKLE